MRYCTCACARYSVVLMGICCHMVCLWVCWVYSYDCVSVRYSAVFVGVCGVSVPVLDVVLCLKL